MKLTKRLNLITKLLLTLLLTIANSQGQGQSLEDCHRWAIDASSATAQSALAKKVQDLNDQNFGVSNLPSLMFNGSASYQSDVFSLPFQLPGSDVPEIPKDQYNVSLNIQQKLYDGGLTKKQRSIAKAETNLQLKELAVAEEQVRQIVNDLYFGILLTEAQLTLQESILEELENRIATARSGLVQGVLLASSVKQLEKEKLKTIQAQTSLQNRNQALRVSLSDWTGQDLMTAILITPDPVLDPSSPVHRKELQVFDQKQEILTLQSGLASNRLQPRLFAFGNVGYGQPNPLNFFETDWNGYYMIGAKLQWQIWDWGNTKRTRQILGLRGTSVMLEKDHFLKQINQKQNILSSDIQQMESQVTIDEQLVFLQQEILNEASLRLDEGTLSHTDYITELNNLNQLKSQQLNHQISLIYQKINYLTLIGQL
jgi:outer membrane protein TolC